MSNLNTILQNQLAKLSPEYVEMIQSDFVSEMAYSLGLQAGISNNQIEDLEVELYYFLILIHKKPDFFNSLRQSYGLSNEQAELLILAVEALLPPDIRAVIESESNDSPLPVTQSVPVAAPHATPTPTTLTIDNLRNQAISMWSQYLATADAGQQQGFRNAIASLAASADELSPNPAAPTDDLATLWQTIRDNNRAALPEIDEAARTRITETYTKPTTAGEAPANIISAIKGTADS